MKSKDYWEKRYFKGGNSGQGSYGRLAEFKSKVINSYIKNNDIKYLVDFGCGDGNMTGLIDVEFYIGLDVSTASIARCSKKYPKKNFFFT